VTRRLTGLLLFLLCTICSVAAGEVLSTEQYARLLTETAQRLEQAAARGAAGKRDAKQALARLPEEADVLSTSAQPPRRAHNTELLRSLRGRVEAGPVGWREAGQVLRNLARSVTTRATPPPPGATRVLAGVFERTEFREPWWKKPAQRLQKWLERVGTWLAKHLRLRLPRLNVHLPPGVWRAIGVALIVLLAGAVVFLLAKLLAQMAEPLTDLPPPPRVRQIEILSSMRWRAEAERAVQAGDHRAAVRALHLAALMRLDEAGLVRFDYACSDGRFVNLLRSGGQTDLAQQLLQLNRLFAVIWYGLAPAGEKEYAAAEALLAKLEAVTTP
jgi:hypothetical protein